MEISEGLHISMSVHTVRKEAIKLIVSQVLALLLAFLVYVVKKMCKNAFHSESVRPSVKLHHSRVAILTV